MADLEETTATGRISRNNFEPWPIKMVININGRICDAAIYIYNTGTMFMQKT